MGSLLILSIMYCKIITPQWKEISTSDYRDGFPNDNWSIVSQITRVICFDVIFILINWSLHNFTHDTTPVLWWYMQKFVGQRIIISCLNYERKIDIVMGITDVTFTVVLREKNKLIYIFEYKGKFLTPGTTWVYAHTMLLSNYTGGKFCWLTAILLNAIFPSDI